MAAIVVLLMAASLTGALSQLVTLRSRELAIRYCLGAGRYDIIRLTVRHVGATLGAGLLLGGGVLYSLGALAYALKRPALWPATFGYHEVFHALTVAAAALHFAAVLAIVRRIGA